MHFAIHFQPRSAGLQQGQGLTHLHRRRLVAGAVVAVREQRRLRDQAEALHLLGRHHGDLGQLLRRGVVVDVRVHQHHLPPGQDQPVHAGIGLGAFAQANHLVDVMQVQGRGAPGATQHPIHLAGLEQHGADERQAAPHFNLGELLGHAFAGGQGVVALPVAAKPVVVFGVDDVVVTPSRQAQAELLDALRNDLGPADQRGPRQAFVDHDLHGPQHPLLFALGIRHALVQRALGQVEDRPHRGARGVNKSLQLLAVGLHVLDRPRSHARGCGGLRHGRRNLHHQARVKGLGDQVLRPKAQVRAHISGRHHLALLGLRQFGNGVHGSDFHFHRDRGRAAIERTPKDVGEAQNVVDLVRVVGAASGNDRVAAHLFHLFGQDLGRGVGQRKNQRVGAHRGHHLPLQHAPGRQAQKDVRAVHHLRQRAVGGLLRKDDLVLVHQLGAALINHTGQVGHPDVFARQAQLHQQPQAGQRRCPRA